MGHTSMSKMIHIDACKHLCSSKFSCDTCMLAKHHRLPFQRSHTTTSTCFELIHVDLWGPYKSAALNGAHYFFTIVDDHSRATWTYLVHTKDQIPSILSSFIAYLENHYQKTPKFLRSDNGTEIVTKPILAFLQSKGIIHQKSMVYTPQQNGVVERKHRHLLETARAIKIHAGFPDSFWGHCILSATYLINKMPMQNLNWKSPFEILTHKAPSYDHLRTIGCLCYATINKPHKNKFAPKSTRCVLLGYPPNQKGYLLYDLQTKSIFSCRDVTFNESIFPFKLPSEHPTTSSSFPTFADPIPSDDDDDDNAGPSVPDDSVAPSPDPIQVNSPVPNPVAPSNTSAHVPQSSQSAAQIPLRRSERNTTKPAWLKDFVTTDKNKKSKVSYPLFTQTDIDSIPEDHFAFLANALPHPDPVSYMHACKNDGWVDAMNQELHALETNDTWALTSLPPGHKAINSKWVYKTKFKPDGSIERLKAGLVVKGFNQKEGLDYKHTFSPVAKIATVRVLIALATARGWPLHQLDVNNAFLHGYIDEDIYMHPPEGYSKA